jgi:hypothetical protein
VSRGRYVTAKRLAELRWSLSDEAWAVLHDVDAMRVAATLDLQALHALRQPLRVRQFRNLLKQLSGHGVLARLEARTVGGRKAGSSGFIYVVGPAGQRLLAAERPQPVRRTWTPRPNWLQHALAVSHLYVGLRQVERAEAVRLEAFEAEPRCWRLLPETRQSLKPDAYVQLGLGDYVDHYFIEVDCGTESPATIGRKLEAYRRYWRSGVEQHTSGVFPRVLWLAPSAKRRDVLTNVLTRQPADSWSLHRVVLYDAAPGVFVEEPP